MKYFIIFLILVGFVSVVHASHDETTHLIQTQTLEDKCDLSRYLERYDELLQQDVVVKTFFEKYPDAILNPPITVDESDPPKADINYKYEKENIKIKFQIYVREIGTVSSDCFVPVYYTYQHQDGDETLNVQYYYNQQMQAIDTLNGYSITSPYEQLRQGVELDDVKCRLGFQKITKYNGFPACVTLDAKEKLIERGWAIGDASKFQEMLEQLGDGPQDVSTEHAELIKGLVVLDPAVSEFLEGRTWEYTCCGYLLNEEKRPDQYKLVINFFDYDDEKQLAVIFDLETLQVVRTQISDVVRFQPFVGEN